MRTKWFSGNRLAVLNYMLEDAGFIPYPSPEYGGNIMNFYQQHASKVNELLESVCEMSERDCALMVERIKVSASLT